MSVSGAGSSNQVHSTAEDAEDAEEHPDATDAEQPAGNPKGGIRPFQGVIRSDRSTL
jgi:hypothetical protein